MNLKGILRVWPFSHLDSWKHPYKPDRENLDTAEFWARCATSDGLLLDGTKRDLMWLTCCIGLVGINASKDVGSAFKTSL